VKYRGPNGETWSGGRGRKPQWVMQALKEGRDIEEFAVKNGR
jgi:DNA-binding protein H-NS